MINLSSGLISFDDGLHIASDEAVEVIEKISGAREVRTILERRQFSLGPHLSGGQNWGVGVVFSGSKLLQVWLQCLTCVDQSALSLDNEKARQRFHDSILEAMVRSENIAINRLGVNLEARTAWGKVSSVLDPRGVQALLIVSYD